MAAPAVLDTRQILVKIGDGASTEVFTQTCVLNLNRAIAFSTSTTEEEVFDCTDATALAITHVIKKGARLQVSGGGKAHKTTMLTMAQWVLDDAAKNVQIEIGGTGGLRIECAMHLTEFTPAEGEVGAYASGSMTLVSTGAISVESIT